MPNKRVYSISIFLFFSRLFGPTCFHFPPYSISKFSTLLVYLVHWSYSLMKFTQDIHSTFLFGPTHLIGTWEYCAHSPAKPTTARQEWFELLEVSNISNYSFSNTKVAVSGSLRVTIHTVSKLSADAVSLWNTVKQASRPQIILKTQPLICLDYKDLNRPQQKKCHLMPENK